MHLSRKSAKLLTVSLLSWAPLLRMMSVLMGLEGPVIVTKRTLGSPEIIVATPPKRNPLSSSTLGGNSRFRTYFHVCSQVISKQRIFTDLEIRRRACHKKRVVRSVNVFSSRQA